MKNGWQKKPLGELCEVVGGGTPPKDNPAFYSGKIPWATVRDMRQEVITETECRITKDAVQSSATNIIPSGNVVIATRVGLGKVCLLAQDTAINQDLRGIIPRDTNKLSVRFLFWWLKSISEVIIAEGTGATVQGVKLPFVKSLQIPFIPLAEQQRIVGVLDEAFAGLATAQANAEKNLQNARALFASHLQSVFTQRGKRWVEKTLENCCEQIFAGGDVPKDRLSLERTTKYGVPIFSNGEKNDGLYGFTDVARVLKPSITVSARGTLGFTKIRTEPFLPVVRLIVLVPDEKQIMLPFLYYAVVGMDFGNTGTSIPQLTVPNFKESKLHVPSLSEQKQIVAKLDGLSAETQRLATLSERKLAALAALKKSLLNEAFTGKLIKDAPQPVIAPLLPLLPPIPSVPGFTPINLHAGILAIGYQAYEQAGRQWHFGHVVAEKFSHMTEAMAGIDLGRNPVQDHFGPDDHNHFKKLEHRARMANYFTFQAGKKGKIFVKDHGFASLVAKTRAALGELNQKVDEVIKLMLPMDMERAEVFATVYAAWNNLLMDKQTPTDEQIVLAARENWHPDKLKIPRENFFKTIEWIRKKNICPQGRGKRVVQRS